jgi:hypothetical protein
MPLENYPAKGIPFSFWQALCKTAEKKIRTNVPKAPIE